MHLAGEWTERIVAERQREPSFDAIKGRAVAGVEGAVGLKLIADFAHAVGAMTRVRDVFEPVPSRVELFRNLHERVYLKM